MALPKIKIAYLFPSTLFGGAERVTLNFLKKVNRDRFDLRPLALVRPWEKKNTLVEILKDEGYSVFEVPVSLRPFAEGADYFRIPRCYKIIYNYLVNGSFDLVHTHGYFADIIAIPLAKALHIQHIATCHSYHLFAKNDIKLRIYDAIDHYFLRYADRIIAVSKGIGEELLKSGINKSRISVIQNSTYRILDEAAIHEKRLEKRKILNFCEKDFVLGFAGRLSWEKGIVHLIEACAILLADGYPIKTLILGDGPQKKELENMIRQKKIDNDSFCMGFQENIEEWMPAMDAFVLPSLREGTPMVLLEAMSIGVPVIASRVGGIPDVITEEACGILVDPGNSMDIAAAVRKLFLEPDLARKIANNASDLIKSRYSVDVWCRMIEDQYIFLLKNKRGMSR